MTTRGKHSADDLCSCDQFHVPHVAAWHVEASVSADRQAYL